MCNEAGNIEVTAMVSGKNVCRTRGNPLQAFDPDPDTGDPKHQAGPKASQLPAPAPRGVRQRNRKGGSPEAYRYRENQGAGPADASQSGQNSPRRFCPRLNLHLTGILPHPQGAF
jgi:hypothetical protein